MMKQILALLLLVSFVFAQADVGRNWLPIAGLMVLIAFLILALIYMVGHGFNIDSLTFLAKEEIGELLSTIAIIAVLQGAVVFFDTLSTSLLGGENLQDTTLSLLEDELAVGANTLNNLDSMSIVMGKESSKSFFCSIQGLGYSIAPCFSYRALITPVSLAFQAISLTIAELSSIQTLVLFGRNYAFNLILPLGLLFRVFKITRGAGGFLIGLGVALYILLPLGVVFMKELTSLYESTTSFTYPADLPTDFTCDSTDDSSANLEITQGIYNVLQGNLEKYLYLFLIRGTLTTIIAVLMMVLGIRWVSKACGTEINVLALTKVA